MFCALHCCSQAMWIHAESEMPPMSSAARSHFSFVPGLRRISRRSSRVVFPDLLARFSAMPASLDTYRRLVNVRLTYTHKLRTLSDSSETVDAPMQFAD